MLDLNLHSLPGHFAEKVLIGLPPEKLAVAHVALSRMGEIQEDSESRQVEVLIMLEHLRDSVVHETHVRVQAELQRLHDEMDNVVSVKDRRAAARILRDLSALVGRRQQAYGPVPDKMAKCVRKLVTDAMGLLRDMESNSEGSSYEI